MEKHKRGDVREDGMVFWGYKGPKEVWTTQETIAATKLADKQRKIAKRSTKRGHARLLFQKRRCEAKKDNILFEITEEEILKELPDICPVLGIPLSWGVIKGAEGDRSDSPSLDKFDPKLGYVTGNVFWMSYRANTIKNDATLKEIQAIASWMQKVK